MPEGGSESTAHLKPIKLKPCNDLPRACMHTASFFSLLSRPESTFLRPPQASRTDFSLSPWLTGSPPTLQFSRIGLETLGPIRVQGWLHTLSSSSSLPPLSKESSLLLLCPRSSQTITGPIHSLSIDRYLKVTMSPRKPETPAKSHTPTGGVAKSGAQKPNRSSLRSHVPS
jgi:hypothetical protein